jgi:hypothetical protein
MGSAALDHDGNLAVAYSLSSSTLHPSIRFAARAPGDTLGTLGAELIIKDGTGSQTTGLSRWGDYSSISVDPVDDCTLWYTTEYQQTNGTFNWSTRIANFKLGTCGSVASPDYSIAASPASQSVLQGGGTSYTATVTPSNGFTGTVSFSVAGLPSGATAAFSPTSVTTSGSTTMSVTTAATTPSGSYPLTITGTSGSLSHSTSVTLVVNSAGDFSIAASPASQTVVAGTGTTYSVSEAGSGGFNGTVNFSVSGLPTGASASFNPTSVVGSGSSTLTVNTATSTAAGAYTLTVTGASGSLSHSTTVTLVVNPAPNPDFTITASPASRTVGTPGSTTYTVTIAKVNGFNGVVSLSVTGLPSRTTGSFSPTSVTGSGTSTLTISTRNRTAIGTFVLTIKGTSGTLSHSTTVSLTTN